MSFFLIGTSDPYVTFTVTSRDFHNHVFFKTPVIKKTLNPGMWLVLYSYFAAVIVVWWWGLLGALGREILRGNTERHNIVAWVSE